MKPKWHVFIASHPACLLCKEYVGGFVYGRYEFSFFKPLLTFVKLGYAR